MTANQPPNRQPANHVTEPHRPRTFRCFKCGCDVTIAGTRPQECRCGNLHVLGSGFPFSRLSNETFGPVFDDPSHAENVADEPGRVHSNKFGAFE